MNQPQLEGIYCYADRVKPEMLVVELLLEKAYRMLKHGLPISMGKLNMLAEGWEVSGVVRDGSQATEARLTYRAEGQYHVAKLSQLAMGLPDRKTYEHPTDYEAERGVQCSRCGFEGPHIRKTINRFVPVCHACETMGHVVKNESGEYVGEFGLPIKLEESHTVRPMLRELGFTVTNVIGYGSPSGALDGEVVNLILRGTVSSFREHQELLFRYGFESFLNDHSLRTLYVGRKAKRPEGMVARMCPTCPPILTAEQWEAEGRK
jgi:hypothetical protein